MIHLAAILLNLTGFAALCTAMSRHQSDLIGVKLPKRMARPLRVAGFVLLAAAFAIDAVALGPGSGAISWFGHLSIGAGLAVAALCVRVHRRRAPQRKPQPSRRAEPLRTAIPIAERAEDPAPTIVPEAGVMVAPRPVVHGWGGRDGGR